MSGFVAIYREMTEHHLFAGDSARLGAWTWLVAKACWRPTKFNVNGKTITLDRGQFCTSMRDLAEAWGWSKSSVERFLTRLKTETMIETHTGTGRLIVTICNYSKYQDVSEQAGTATGTPTGTAAGQQRDTKEQENKGTIEEEPIGSPSLPEKPKPVSRAHALPADWEPKLTPAAQRIVDGWPPGKFVHELARFRDHAADKGRTSKDWQAAFRTWITKSDEWMKQNGNRNYQDAGGSAAGNRGSRVRTDGFTDAINAELARTGSLRPAEAAGRWDDGPASGHDQLPLAAGRLLR